MARATVSNRARADIWTPAELPGLGCWCRASTIKVAADGSAISDGAKVRRWLDESPRKGHLYNNTASEQPTYVASSNNGLPAINFTRGSFTRLSSAKPFAANVIAAWAVMAYTGGAAFVGNDALITENQATPVGSMKVSGKISTTEMYGYGGENFVDGVSGGTGTLDLTDITAFHYVLLQDSPAVAFDGGVIVGRDGSAGGNAWSGPVQEIGIITGSLSTPNRALLFNYLAETYGL